MIANLYIQDDKSDKWANADKMLRGMVNQKLGAPLVVCWNFTFHHFISSKFISIVKTNEIKIKKSIENYPESHAWNLDEEFKLGFDHKEIFKVMRKELEEDNDLPYVFEWHGVVNSFR